VDRQSHIAVDPKILVGKPIIKATGIAVEFLLELLRGLAPARSVLIGADAHLISILRYVQRNPLRAGRVTHAERWRWGSLDRRIQGTAAEQAFLSAGPVPLGVRGDNTSTSQRRNPSWMRSMVA
jgi:hypothetical protein